MSSTSTSFRTIGACRTSTSRHLMPLLAIILGERRGLWKKRERERKATQKREGERVLHSLLLRLVLTACAEKLLLPSASFRIRFLSLRARMIPSPPRVLRTYTQISSQHMSEVANGDRGMVCEERRKETWRCVRQNPQALMPDRVTEHA